MKYREHEKIVRQMLQQHDAEKAALREQIANLKETVELLRTRAQKAERKVVEAADLWWSEETNTIPDYELADHERPIVQQGTWY